MKLRLQKFSISHYVKYMKRQSVHIQHVHAIAFAGIITALLTGVILYTDYGFWHETYVAEDVTQMVADTDNDRVSWGSFFTEAKVRFSQIGSQGVNLLEGKETYKKE